MVLFETFLNDCQAQNIAVVLVHAPIHTQALVHLKNQAAIVQLFRTIAEKHGLPFLDYSNDPMGKDKAYFYNASHLNKTGAQLFTQQFIHDLQQLRR